jgi:MerR family transcriptional regulator, light-induced transcriptional regulator
MNDRERSSGANSEGPEYSIRVVSRLTGLSADTLRMWERRYGYPSPRRTESGLRLYARADIERLTLIARGIKLGYRVGETVGLDQAALRQRLAAADTTTATAGDACLAHDLVDHAIADEPDSLRVGLRRAAVTLGTKRFITEVATPLLHELGDAWSQGALEVQQEHLATEILQAQLHVMAAAYEGATGPVVVLSTLPKESHGLGLQLVGLYLAACGALPRILGADTPTAQIAGAAKALKADAVAISVSVAASSVAATNHLNSLVEVLDRTVALWVGGQGAARIRSLPERAVRLRQWAELEDALAVSRRLQAPR